MHIRLPLILATATVIFFSTTPASASRLTRDLDNHQLAIQTLKKAEESLLKAFKKAKEKQKETNEKVKKNLSGLYQSIA